MHESTLRMCSTCYWACVLIAAIQHPGSSKPVSLFRRGVLWVPIWSASFTTRPNLLLSLFNMVVSSWDFSMELMQIEHHVRLGLLAVPTRKKSLPFWVQICFSLSAPQSDHPKWCPLSHLTPPNLCRVHSSWCGDCGRVHRWIQQVPSSGSREAHQKQDRGHIAHQIWRMIHQNFHNYSFTSLGKWIFFCKSRFWCPSSCLTVVAGSYQDPGVSLLWLSGQIG